MLGLLLDAVRPVNPNNPEGLLQIGDILQAVSIVPILAFFIDYVIIRPGRHNAFGDRFIPWWHSSIGWMFALLSLAGFLTNLVVVLSLTFGGDYPLRWLVRIIGFGTQLAAMVTLYIVYTIESRAPLSEMSPKSSDTEKPPAS